MTEMNDPKASIMPGLELPAIAYRPYECGCMTCVDKAQEQARMIGMILPVFFIACPLCGNKRCPKATLHSNDCTSSNEPGQPGSAYGALPQDEENP